MKHSKWLLTLIFVLVPALALASGTAVVDQEGNLANVAWTADSVYVEEADADSDADDFEYMVLRDGSLYMVGTEDGEPMVLDMSDMIAMAMGLAASFGDDDASGMSSLEDEFQIESMEATGENRTVAGIEGAVYEATITESDGETQTWEFVFTGDPLAEEMTQTILTGLLQALRQEDAADYLQAHMPDDKRGVLMARDGDGTVTKLDSISGDEPDADLFELPAEPMTFADMMRQAMQEANE